MVSSPINMVFMPVPHLCMPASCFPLDSGVFISANRSLTSQLLFVSFCFALVLIYISVSFSRLKKMILRNSIVLLL